MIGNCTDVIWVAVLTTAQNQHASYQNPLAQTVFFKLLIFLLSRHTEIIVLIISIKKPEL